MKKSELKKLIKEEIAKVLSENENKIDINNLPKNFISYKSMIDRKRYYEDLITGALYDENGNFIRNLKQASNSKNIAKNTPDADDETLDLLNLLNKKYNLIQQGDQKTINQMDKIFDIMDFSEDLYEKFRIFADDTTGNTLISGNSLFLSPHRETIEDQNIQQGGEEMLNGEYYSEGKIDGMEFYWVDSVY
jgi:hypothetical protein